jgi:hypothetical protein
MMDFDNDSHLYNLGVVIFIIWLILFYALVFGI